MNSKIFCMLLPFSLFAARGELLHYTKKATLSSNEHRGLCNAFSIECDKAKECFIYTFEYETLTAEAQKTTASSVLIVPQNNQKPDLLVYLHGTVADKDEAPSHLGYHMQLPLSVFAQGDYNIVVPDYLGLGQSSCNFHPFCHAGTLASASYDATLAACTLLKKLKAQQPSSLYIAGYSEGGMAALALHKYVEEHPIKALPLKASCPMSGPYDLSSSLGFALNSTSSRMNTYISYLISSYNLIYPNILPPFNTIFSPAASYMIPLLFDGCHPFWTINGILTKITPLLNPDFIATTLTRHSPFYQKLLENNTYTFYPTIPLHFIALENDSEVGYINSQQAYNYMIKKNAPVSLENASSTLDHMQGSPLCHMRALKFFQSLK